MSYSKIHVLLSKMLNITYNSNMSYSNINSVPPSPPPPPLYVWIFTSRTQKCNFVSYSRITYLKQCKYFSLSIEYIFQVPKHPHYSGILSFMAQCKETKDWKPANVKYAAIIKLCTMIENKKVHF